ncbi:hypothetical protein FRC12_013590 [Ceratobasidium sp. 428]|nr:hypothetical protein FRC12_013590 [Ceratobasidium sp. 428]
MQEEKRLHDIGVAAALEQLETEREAEGRALNEQLRKYMKDLKEQHAKRSALVQEEYEAEILRIQAGERMTAKEIRDAERKERKKRHSLLTSKEEREVVLSAMATETPAKATADESSDDEYVTPVRKSIPVERKSRVSLGTNATALMSQIPVTPAKGQGKETARQEVPSGGYLANVLTARAVGNQPTDSGKTPHTPGQASPSKAVSFDTSRWPYRSTTPASLSTPLRVATGGKPGGGGSDGSSSSDSEYKRMSQPEKRAYKKVK